MISRLRIVSLMSVIALLSSVGFAQRRDLPLMVDYAPPPQTWEEAANRSDVTALIRLVGSQQKTLGNNPMTIFEAEVAEVIRNEGRYALEPVIRIARFGGIRQTSDGIRILEEAHFPRWSEGTTFVVFLDWFEPWDSYSLPFGPNSAFELDEKGKVRTFGRSGIAARQNGRPFPEFVAEVKSKVNRSR